MTATVIENGRSAQETLPAVIPQQTPAPALLGADELDQVLEVAEMVAEGADRLHLESLATRIRAQAMRAVRELEEMRQLVADPKVTMYRVDMARTNAVDAAREVASLVRDYRKRERQIAERRAKRQGGAS